MRGVELRRKASIKFLAVLLDENLTSKDHISTIENKIDKNIGLIFRAKNVLNKNSLIKLYYSFIHSYLNYTNMAWSSTHKPEEYYRATWYIFQLQSWKMIKKHSKKFVVFSHKIIFLHLRAWNFLVPSLKNSIFLLTKIFLLLRGMEFSILKSKKTKK